MMKVLKIIILGIILGTIGFIVSVPFVNDLISKKTAEKIKNTPLPKNTEYIESFSIAGKLVGSGNGMQYLGGILVKSELSLEALQDYYVQYATADYEYVVEDQINKKISVIEHGNLDLQTDVAGDGYYIVYSWGESAPFWSEFDIRGH